jgi:energy-coupling factor transporter ATP-binding protein EcfA2
MSAINFGTSVSLTEAAALIANNPEMRFLLRGEAGIGKSTLIELLKRLLPGHAAAYIDAQSMDLGDAALPAADHELKVMEYYTNKRFKMYTGQPVIIMIDEFTKAMQPVQNMLHPLLETNNPRLGDVPLPAGSIVFLTGNLSNMGVGDNLKAHTLNRVTDVEVRKPDSEEWLLWAVGNLLPEAAPVMAWVRQFPQCLDPVDFHNPDVGNPYIANPKTVQKSFVSARSLERVSYAVARRHHYSDNALLAAMSGTIGEAAARDMQAFIAYQDQLPPWKTIIEDPKNAAVPDTAGACAVLVFGAVSRVDKQSLPGFMEYLKRMDTEWQAVFAVSLAKHPAKAGLAYGNKEFASWVAQNQDVL